MKSLLSLALLATFVSFTTPNPGEYADTTTAALAGYLKIPDIPGESTDRDHRGWVEIGSWSWGETNRDALKQARANFQKRVDRTSPQLERLYKTKKVIPKVIIDLRNPSSNNSASYSRYTLWDVSITSQTRLDGSGDLPVEEIIFAFRRISEGG